MSTNPGRPRLIQEGSPIYAAASNTSLRIHRPLHNASSAAAWATTPPSNNEGDCEMEEMVGIISDHQPIRKITAMIGITSSSSLIAASRKSLSNSNKKNPIRKKMTTRLVIGEPSATNNDTVEVHEMEVERSPSSLERSVTRHRPPASTHDITTLPENNDNPIINMMDVDEIFGPKPKVIVMDGANIAHAYSEAKSCRYSADGSRSSSQSSSTARGKYSSGTEQPDAEGVRIAVDYFLEAGLKVVVVVPSFWCQCKPRQGDDSKENAIMMTNNVQILQDLHTNGHLCKCPPRDDDDAYVISIARRAQRKFGRGGGGGFVLSNDLFRDAIRRDSEGDLDEWLNRGIGGTGNGGRKPGRISFAFYVSVDDLGREILDFVPNPRHAEIAEIEHYFNEIR